MQVCDRSSKGSPCTLIVKVRYIPSCKRARLEFRSGHLWVQDPLFYNEVVEVVLQWLRPCFQVTAGSIPAAEPSTFYAPSMVELYIRGLRNNTHTHADMHKDKWNRRESSLSLLNGEKDNMKDSKHPRWVSHIKIKLMALQWLKFSVHFSTR